MRNTNLTKRIERTPEELVEEFKIIERISQRELKDELLLKDLPAFYAIESHKEN